MDISKPPRIWPTYYGICLYVHGGVRAASSSLLLELALAMTSKKCIPQILGLIFTKSSTIFLGKRWREYPIRFSAIQSFLWNTNSIREAVISIITPLDLGSCINLASSSSVGVNFDRAGEGRKGSVVDIND